MTNEQKETIDRLNKDKNRPLACGDITVVNIADIDTVLSLIKEQKEEIDGLKNINKNQSKDIKKAVDYTFELNKQLKQKDKQIDLMAKYIDKIDVSEDFCEGRTMCDEDCENCIKQYFADLVEKE